MQGFPHYFKPVVPLTDVCCGKYSLADMMRQVDALFGPDCQKLSHTFLRAPLQARTLGPWSSAVELVNAREQAAQDREDKIMKLAREEEEGMCLP